MHRARYVLLVAQQARIHGRTSRSYKSQGVEGLAAEEPRPGGEAWLVYDKKHTGKLSVTYRESLEEALCFAWIDGVKKRVDDERYMHRFSPRKPKSKWSPLNIRLAKQRIDEGKMTKVGLAAFERRLETGFPSEGTKRDPMFSLSAEVENALKAHMRAWANFEALAPSYKKQYTGWLMSAKKEETRVRRLKEAIRLLSEGKKLGMK